MIAQYSKIISYDDFTKVEIRVGTILAAEVNQKAKKPAYKLQIDFGEYGIKTSSAQITEHYHVQDLIGKQIVAVMNFQPKLIAGVKSEVLVLAAVSEEKGTILLHPTTVVPNGSRIF